MLYDSGNLMLWFNPLNTASLLAGNRHIGSTPRPGVAHPGGLTRSLWHRQRAAAGGGGQAGGGGPGPRRPGRASGQRGAGAGRRQCAPRCCWQGWVGHPGCHYTFTAPSPGLLMFHGFYPPPFLLLRHTPFTGGCHLLDNFSRFLRSAWACQ